MKRLSRPHPSQPNFDWAVDSPALRARLRMVELPLDESKDLESQVIFTADDLWVPLSVVNGNIHILPGVPRICKLRLCPVQVYQRTQPGNCLVERMLDGLKASIRPRLADPEGKGIHRIIFSTPLAESVVAGYLTELAARVEPKGVKVGSYPRWNQDTNTVTLVGRSVEINFPWHCLDSANTHSTNMPVS